MPGGIYDSSLTRVAPLFDALAARAEDWVRQLLQCRGLASIPASELSALDLRFTGERRWGNREIGLQPPLSLLSWLIRNPGHALVAAPQAERQRLAVGDPETIAAALTALRSSGPGKAWYLLEGPTCPDAFIETPDALLVIEGKRTEAGPTLDTTWMPGRHQIWRHIDAAWEIRGRRRVFGFFVVEGRAEDGEVSGLWKSAFETATLPSALASSFPHRSAQETAAIASCFLGGTTWQAICQSFGIPFSSLPTQLDAACPRV